MRILLLVHAFNSLSQRLHVELRQRGHEVAVEFDINDDATREAVALFQPDLVLAPYLKRAIPEDVWRRHVCLVLHPGPRGDRGPSALDWAVLNGEAEWGVTVLQAVAAMDAGPVWATERFPLRPVRKSSLYRHEVTEAGTRACLDAIARHAAGLGPIAADNSAPGRGWQPLMPQAARAIDWTRDDTGTVLRKLWAADGDPGVEETAFEGTWRWFGGWPAHGFHGRPGALLARRDGAICRATVDGAVWITHARRIVPGVRTFKQPAADALGPVAGALAEHPYRWSDADDTDAFREIRYVEHGPVGLLYFDFYNGAMSTGQCRRLLQAWRWASSRPTRVIALMGGRDFWSNGLDLKAIEAADSPADESWRNINAMDDLSAAIVQTTDRLTVAALHGNAGAGGVFLALAADRVIGRAPIVLNPHYRSMGNLYGSEYWTYLLPRRVGADMAAAVTRQRLPMGTAEALRIGLLDEVLGERDQAFDAAIVARALALATDGSFKQRLRDKQRRREQDEAIKPLAAYRAEELAHMRLNFYGFDPSYHVARYRFVHRERPAWTPLYLAPHRHPALRTTPERLEAAG